MAEAPHGVWLRRRAIRERAEFFDDVFRTLLLDDPPDGHVTRIL
jgi:hypothetical protein